MKNDKEKLKILKNNLEEFENRIENLKKSTSERKNYNKTNGLRAEGVLAELIAGLVFGVFVGILLDNYFNTKPLFIITLIILGLAASMYNIYKDAVKDQNDDNIDS